MKSRAWCYVVALALLGAGVSCAQDTNVHEDVIARYEQILERAPVRGPSFDKLLQIYQEGDGLEKLDERWTPLSAQPGAKGATYSLLRGLLADRMGKTDAARKLLQAAAQAQPDDFHGWLAVGDFEVQQGKWTDAIAALQKGLATPVTGEDRLALYRKLGQAQERNLDLPAALATWQKMVAEFPKNAFALEEAGSAELDAEQFDESRKTFQKLVDLTEPNSMNRVQALMHLAEVDDRQGKTDAAVHDYEAILPLTAQASWLNRELRAQIEQVYRRQEDLAGLVTYYQKWTQDNPKDVEALLLLAGTLNELGKKPEALEVLRKVATLAPDRHEVRQSLAEALVEAKKYDEAITVLTALTADDPTEPRYWATMGSALWLKTQPPTAESKKAVLEAWGHIAPADSKDVVAILQVADLCHDRGLNDEALANYQRALALTPDASDVREKAVKLLVEMKRPDDAWKLLDQMTDGTLATAGNYLKLASLDQQFGRKEEATAAIQKGLALEPANFDLLSVQWGMLAEAQKWSDCVALFDKLSAAAPNAYFTDQLEARQLQALTSAGMLDDAEKKLHAKLGADPGLTESELRLLLRMLIQKSDPDIAKAFDEGHRRFPQSVSLTRIEIDYDRHVGSNDAAVTALQKLIETVPAQKADWLGEIVRVRREQGNLDEAMKVAQQIISASPASADGYLLYADIALAAGKPDDAVTKLQAAIKLSDKPNEVRQRLAHYYLDAGQAAKARTIYDEAFSAAETPQDKLTIVRAMAIAYFQDGQIEVLINRFKKEQGSEEGGWRYGLYLSAIDEQMQDYGAARRELAKSLAIRPTDTALLRSLIGLAEKENDRAELLRYREMLAAADPTATNEIALANEYALQEKPEDVWRIVQKNLGEVAKDPMAWKDVLNQVTDPAYQAKIKGVLEEAIRTKGDPFGGKFALVQFQMQQGDLEGAKGTMWEILALPLPPPAAPKPGTTAATPAPASPMYSFYQSPLMQRASQSYLAINEAQQLFQAQAQRRNQSQVFYGRGRMFGRMGVMNNVTTTLDPMAIRDRSLVYLSLIAVQQKQAAEFLKELEAKFDEWHWSQSDKLVAYMLIQAREPLLQEIERQAQSATPDRDLDQFCYLAAQQFMAANNEESIRKRGEAVQATLAARLGQDPQFKNFITMNEIGRMAADTTPEGMAKRTAAVLAYVKSMDHQDPQQLFEAIQLYAQLGNWAEIKKTVDELAAIPPAKWNAATTQQLSYFPMGILQQATTTKETMPKEVLPVIMELLRMGYPTTPPRAPLPTVPSVVTVSGGMVITTGGYAFYNQNNFPPSNRYFPPNRVGILEPMFQQLKAREMLPAMYAALDQEEKDLTDWRKIYPQLIRIYFQWWDNKHDAAIASVRKLLEQDPSDDWRMLLAKMLEMDKKYADAIPVLDGVSARYGPAYIQTQKQLLHLARLAGNNEVGQKAALRLLSLHLPQQEQLQLMDDMQNVGLKDKAAEIMAKQQQQNRTVANVRATAQANNQLMQTLNEAVQHNDPVKAADLARQVLNHDPTAPQQFGNENYLRTQAIAALKKSGQLNGYLQDVVKQLAAAPDSARLNWLVAEAYGAAPDLLVETQGLLAGYHWFKLQRKGDDFEAYSSRDGTNWKLAGGTKLQWPARIYVGTWVSSRRGEPAAVATFDQIVLTGKIAATDPAPAPPLAPWLQTDIGKVITPGTAVLAAGDKGMVVTGALSGESPLYGRDVRFNVDDACHFVYQLLDGDGAIVARVADILPQPGDINAGVVMRETLDPRSRDFELSVSQDQGFFFEARDRSGGSQATNREITERGWFKLARAGNKFTASYSTDSKTWNEIFTRQVDMKPDVLAGMYIRRLDPGGEAVWADVKVNGAAVTPATDGTLPAPWQTMDIGSWATPGKINWTANGLHMDSPAKGGGEVGNCPFGGYVMQPLTGDGEIVARLDLNTPGGAPDMVTGLCFRESKEVNAPAVYFISGADGNASLISKTDPQAQSLRYYKRVVELSPKNTAMVFMLADKFRQAHQSDAAADLYAALLKSDFANAMNQYGNMIPVFTEANRLPEFVKIVTETQPPSPNIMGGGGQDMYFVFLQLGNQLKQTNHLPEAEQVYRKALSVESYQSKQDAVSALAQLLVDQGKKDDAAGEIEKWILKKDAPVTPPPILGFNTPQPNQNNNWFQNVGWNSNGVIMMPIIHFLQLADALGLTPKLRQEMKTRLAQNTGPKPVAGQIDPNRLASIVLAIIARDPSYRSEVDQLLKDLANIPQTMSYNGNSLLIISQLLEKWPQERPTALKVAQQVYDGLNIAQGNAMIQNFAGMQMLRLAQASGDHKTAQEVLRKRVDRLREQRAINPNMMPLDQVLVVVQALVSEGMIKEATDVMTEAKSDPQMANGNSYFGQKFAQVQQQIAFAKGEVEPVALVYGLAPAGGKGKGTEFYWELSADKGQTAGGYSSTVTWSKDVPARPTTYRIEVNGGPNESNATTRVATYENVPLRGSAPIKIPAGMQVLQATLIRTKPLTPPAPGAQGPMPVASGHFILLGGPENLLKNPDFTVTTNATGQRTIEGWHGLLPGEMGNETGGPMPAGGFQTLSGNNNNGSQGEIRSDHIPVQAGLNYALSGWIRGPINMGVRSLDADGKVLHEEQLNPNRDGWTWNSSTFGEQGPGRRNGGTPIPANTASFEIFFRPNQDFSVAGLAFRVWPTAAPAPAAK